MADVVIVEGPDAASYLQGQITQDVNGLAVGDAAWTFVLEPTGRVASLARLERAGTDRFELTVDAGWGATLQARLARFKLRVKAELTLVESADEPGHDSSGRTPIERIATGWPAMGAEIAAGETIPAETGLNPLAVSFTKGCYTGQELVERMDARQAAAPRRLVRLHAATSLTAGDELHLAGKVVGRVTTAVDAVALAYVARSVPDDATLDGGVRVEPIVH
jgi:tRNA-modifying protein YgfZ